MKAARGVSFVDVIVGTALILIVFVTLVGLLRASVLVSSVAKAKAGATAVAENQIEYIRGIAYDSVGTVGGIPAGTIAQYATTTLNHINYGVRTLIEYYDDPADGTSTADTNTITTDYKRIKIAVTYLARGLTREVDVVSNYAPQSIETTTGGGTLQIRAVDATGAALPGASVRIVNASTSPTIDFTTFSDSTGYVALPGAPTSTQYQINVSKSGYSTAQTYARDATNQNPNPGYFTVVKNVTTSGTFAIDLLASLTAWTLAPASPSSFVDPLTGATQLAATASTTISSGALVLMQSAGLYALAGSARSIAITPTSLGNWSAASSTRTLPAGTSMKLHITDGTSALVPDAALAGNSAGFTSFPIDLTGLSTTTYPSLGLSADLATTNTANTPQILDWTLGYASAPTGTTTTFTLTGAKTIGTTGAGASIYKTTVSTTTPATGLANFSLEWDSYTLSVSGKDVVNSCMASPFVLSPNTSSASTVMVSPTGAVTLLVTVKDSAGVVVPGATVRLSKLGATEVVTTNSCGTAAFSGIASGSAYSVSASKSGYTTVTNSNLSISGHATYTATFP